VSDYCDDCNKKRNPRAGVGGGTFCAFHKQEICKHLEPHCHRCGKPLNQTSEDFRKDMKKTVGDMS
jgi:hypothetical protein